MGAGWSSLGRPLLQMKTVGKTLLYPACQQTLVLGGVGCDPQTLDVPCAVAEQTVILYFVNHPLPLLHPCSKPRLTDACPLPAEWGGRSTQVFVREPALSSLPRVQDDSPSWEKISWLCTSCNDS